MVVRQADRLTAASADGVPAPDRTALMEITEADFLPPPAGEAPVPPAAER
ncbi:MAG: hypothetical protein LUF91_02050 [Oscillospiraceae bacterium]|nr:hypothetical protein [Oscillospiraceae bacterium]